MHLNTDAVAAFFDQRAETWDAHSSPREDVINTILDVAGIARGVSVLDVGCGTGVLFPYYLARGAAAVTGVDISPAMIAQAKAKFGSDPRVALLCGDASALAPGKFDTCVVFNALPHFQSARTLIDALSKALVPGGRLTIAHGDSRQVINARHTSGASEVSRDLMPADELAGLFRPLFRTDALHDDEDYYLVSGVLK
ncbi:MAG TPA: class I SAM-dependent methyltransferase [Feifaniaceae bacterium]|nr:class I SAM-dependent methyltransferase [Feifaniaceae bacterium]